MCRCAGSTSARDPRTQPVSRPWIVCRQGAGRSPLGVRSTVGAGERDSLGYRLMAPEAAQVARLKKFMNYLGEGVGPERCAPTPRETNSGPGHPGADAVIGAPIVGGFLHQIRRAGTKADFFRICREFLDHDQPMTLEPVDGKSGEASAIPASHQHPTSVGC